MRDYGPPAAPRRVRTFVLATLFFGFAGLVNLFSPLDLMLNGISNGLRSPAVDDRFIILEVNDRIEDVAAGEAWSDMFASELVSLLNSLDVESAVIIEPIFTSTSEFPLLAEALEQNGNVVSVSAAASLELDAQDAAIQDHLVSSNYFKRYWGGVEFGSFGAQYGEVFLPSPESKLAGKTGEAGDQFEIDYAFDIQEFQTLELSAVTAPDFDRSLLQGKRLVVTQGSHAESHPYLMPSQGNGSLAEVVLMAAMTLGEERPLNAGFIPAWIFSILFVGLMFSRRYGPLALRWAPVALSCMVVFPILMDVLSIRTSSGHAIGMISFGILIAWMRLKKRETANKAFTHHLSGLPSAQCLSAHPGRDERVLVAAVITNYAAISAGISPEQEGMTANTIARALPSTGAVYQGELGQFYWLQSEFDEAEMSELFEATANNLNRGVIVGDRTLVLQVAFGVERITSGCLASRLKTAESAAQGAARQRKTYKLHDQDAQDALLWQSRILFELDEALRNQEIEIALQPQLDLTSDRITSAEVLVRWTHEEMGVISPTEFVEMAERGKRIDRLTQYVVQSSFRFLREAQKIDPDFNIAVNISPGLIGDPEFEFMMQAALRVYAVPATSIMLEITENEQLLNNPGARDAMNRLRQAGFGISIDDYGAGLSTVTYLLEVPANEVKLDRTLIWALQHNERSRLLIQSTISVAQSLGMQVVAEGVEDPATLSVLQRLGCDLAQGYFIGQPVSPEEIMSLLRYRTTSMQAAEQA